MIRMIIPVLDPTILSWSPIILVIILIILMDILMVRMIVLVGLAGA